MDSTIPSLAFAPGKPESSAEKTDLEKLDEKGEAQATKIAVEEVQAECVGPSTLNKRLLMLHLLQARRGGRVYGRGVQEAEEKDRSDYPVSHHDASFVGNRCLLFPLC